MHDGLSLPHYKNLQEVKGWKKCELHNFPNNLKNLQRN
jgi:hypothetical protein